MKHDLHKLSIILSTYSSAAGLVYLILSIASGNPSMLSYWIFLLTGALASVLYSTFDYDPI
jgi:hypothetical protein